MVYYMVKDGRCIREPLRLAEISYYWELWIDDTIISHSMPLEGFPTWTECMNSVTSVQTNGLHGEIIQCCDTRTR